MLNLNDKQQEAVVYSGGPLLVLAGAGTGKTRVIINRIAHILENEIIFPNKILAVTFTNKAAREMTNRINEMRPSSDVVVGTFHSVAAKILRHNASVVGLTSDFNIIGTDEVLKLIKAIIRDFNYDEKKYPATVMNFIIERWKDSALIPAALTESDYITHNHRIAGRIYKEYQDRLRFLNAVDFGDLILHNIEIFKSNSELLTKYQKQFCHILVDEYQDTNIAQYLWLRLLSQSNPNLCCVGDDDQSIYGWRGAEVGNILRFEQDYKNAKIVRLEQNYRSTNHILNVASSVIANNASRLGKKLWTETGDGDKVTVVELWSENEEAKFIAQKIIDYKKEGHNLKDVAILVRAGHQTRVFEEIFINNKIPYQVVGSLRFYERMEIKDVIAYIRLSLNPSDNLAFERIINVPKRGIGNSSLEQINEYARTNGFSLLKAATLMAEKGLLRPKIASEILKFYELLKKWHKDFLTENHAKVIEDIVNDSGYMQALRLENLPENEVRIDNIKEMIRALADFPSIRIFLDHVSLVMDQEKEEGNNDFVSIMTMHSAKGLEFKIVMLPGWEEGIFPSQKSSDERSLEEERRLAYVAITRARAALFITYALSRRVYGKWQYSIRSRFIDELPKDSVIGFTTAKSSNNNQYQERHDGPDYHAPQEIRKKTRVHHVKFGFGYIIGKDDNIIEVQFDKFGIKKIMKEFLEEVR